MTGEGEMQGRGVRGRAALAAVLVGLVSFRAIMPLPFGLDWNTLSQ
jgi:hypothetical protein